jgi:hypothetical protein
MNYVVSLLAVGTHQHRRVIRWRIIVEAALRRDSDQGIVVQIERIRM